MIEIRVRSKNSEIIYTDESEQCGFLDTEQYAGNLKKGDQLLVVISHICREVKALERK